MSGQRDGEGRMRTVQREGGTTWGARAAAEDAGLRMIIREQQAAIESLEASREQLEGLVENLLARAPFVAEKPRAGWHGLSKRELQVLELMVAGKTSREIAAELGVSFKTAVTHRANLMAKLKVHETASAVREALRRGLV
jgi:DNA-binding CsgD family transcriptional regulator